VAPTQQRHDLKATRWKGIQSPRHRRAFVILRHPSAHTAMTGAIVVFASIQMRSSFNPEDGGPGVKYALVVRIAKAYDDQTQIVMPQ